MPSPNQVEKEMNHLFLNFLELDPEDEEWPIFMSVLRDIASKHGTFDMPILSHEDLRRMSANLPICLGVEVKSLQLHLKYLQEK